MYNFILCVVIITILNLVTFCTGFFLGFLKFDNDFIEPIKPNKVFFRTKEGELEESYIPEED